MIKARTLRRTGKRVYDVRLRDPKGKVYNRTFATKKAAQEFEVSERAARLRGAWVDPRHASRSFASVAEDWLAADGTKRASSLARDRSILRVHVLPVFGKKAIGSVSRADLQRLVNSWAGLAPSTVGRMFSVTRAVLAYAEASELIVRAPREVRLPRVELVDRPSLGPDDLAKIAGARTRPRHHDVVGRRPRPALGRVRRPYSRRR